MKVNHKLQLIAVFMGMLMLTACGGGGDSTATPPVTPVVTTPSVTSQSLEGLWMTSCSASADLTGYDERQTFNFKGNKLTTTKFFYPHNTNCKHGEVLRAREWANITLGAAVNPGTATSHTKIDIRRTKVMLAPITLGIILIRFIHKPGQNGNKFIYYGYGDTGWDAGYWKDISSIEAAKTNFKIDQSVADIFQISTVMVDGTTYKVLRLGAKEGNIDIYGRPLELAGNITATLQKKTTQEQTLQAAGLIGQWKYSCRKAKENDNMVQSSTLNFMGNKLTTLISFYSSTNTHTGCNQQSEFQVEIEADIVLGKVINKGAVNEHTLIGIKTTKVQIKPMAVNVLDLFNTTDIYNSHITDVYFGYGQTDWRIDDWKDLSSIPDAKTNFNIGREVPDIFKISTVRINNMDRKELQMGDYKGNFDINGRAMSLEDKGAVLQPK